MFPSPDYKKRCRVGGLSLRKPGIIVLTYFLALLLVGCSSGSTNATPTPSTPQFTIIPLNLPAAAYAAPTVGPLDANSQMKLGVNFKVNNSVLPGKNGKITKGQQIDGSQIANEYGISDQTYQRLKEYLGIDDVSLNLGKLHSYMSVTAKTSTIEKLFQTTFIVHKLNGSNYYVPAANQPPELPSFIMGYVVAITGLESYFTVTPADSGLTTRLASSVSPVQAKRANACQGPDLGDPHLQGAVLPQQIAGAYGYNQFYKAGETGQNVTINLAEVGGYVSSDLANYFDCVEYPQSQFSVVDTIPPASQLSPGGTGEAELDIEMIAGLAPGANIVDYEASISPDFGQNEKAATFLYSYFELLNGDLQAIIDNNAQGTQGLNLVSVSYGFGEQDLDPNVIKAIDSSIDTLVNLEQMTVFFSTGDCGAFGGDQMGKLDVQFPASDPNVVAVGGTVLGVNSNDQRARETTWGNAHPTSPCKNLWGTGGGVSKQFKRPSWEVGSGVTNRYSTGGRQLPDVSAVAWNVLVYIGGSWSLDGGTSAATPIWASGFALADELLLERTNSGFFGPQIFYAVADAGNYHPYYDITQGNNLHYAATPNWDDATGWGTPNLPNFYNAMLALEKKS